MATYREHLDRLHEALTILESVEDIPERNRDGAAIDESPLGELLEAQRSLRWVIRRLEKQS